MVFEKINGGNVHFGRVSLHPFNQIPQEKRGRKQGGKTGKKEDQKTREKPEKNL